MANDVKSYHTFLFPFVWDKDSKNSVGDLDKVLSCEHWTPVSGYRNEIARFREYYKVFEYFNESARQLLLPDQSNSVKIFEFVPNEKGQIGKYIIEKDFNKYELTIKTISLNIYNEIGCAVLLLGLEYYGSFNNLLDDIGKINEFGRRINLPYFGVLDEQENGDNHDGFPDIVADKISIDLGNEDFNKELVVDFRAFHKSIVSGEKNISDVSLTYVAKPLKGLLALGSKKRITSNPSKKGDALFIQPLIDDRMFVCCQLNDSSVLGKFDKWNVESGEYQFLADSLRLDFDSPGNTSCALYKFAFIESYPTCQSRTMRRELLNSCSYDRWISYGTIYCATHHSFVSTLTQETYLNPGNWYITENFHLLYVKLCILALLQRATILTITKEASAITGPIPNNKNPPDPYEKTEKLSDLYRRYVETENRFLLDEVTPEEQGIELFNLIKRQLFVEQNKGDLDCHLNNLYELSNMLNNDLQRKAEKDQKAADERRRKHEHSLTTLLAIIAIIALPLAVLDAFFGNSTSDSVCESVLSGLSIPFALLLLVIFTVAFFIWRHNARKGD